MKPLTAKQKRRRLERGRARQRAFVAAGLRTDGKPRVGRKPCGCLFGSCLKCAKTTNALILKPALVRAMWEDYSQGMSLMAVGRKYGKHRKSLNQVFARRGYKLRPAKEPKLGFGVKIPEPTVAEMRVMISQQPRLRVPRDLKIHWRKWSLQRRRWFIALLREKFPSTRPKGKFSSNVTPFEYGTPAAHAIADRLNAGRNSQTKAIALKPCSEGVIYQGELYFWAGKALYVRGTGWRPETGRPPLKHVIWEQANGRPVPEKTVIIQKDGNQNNFLPANLEMISMEQNALRNSIPNRLKTDPKNPELLRKAKLRLERMVTTRSRNRTLRARSAASILVNQFQAGKPALLETLNRRKS